MTPLLYLEQLIRYGHVDAADLPRSNNTWGLQHVVLRLAASLKNTNFGLDQAVLLRQCIRHLEPGQRIVVAQVAPSVLQHFASVGLNFGIDGSIETTPYAPSWLETVGPKGADVPAMQQVVDDQPIPGEAWLDANLGKTNWRSQAQREAAWSALTAPINSTILVGLPTGAGKSFVYQVCAAFQPGLTVVVVPTVALGIDQVNALCLTPLKNSHNPLLYTSDADALSVLEAVRDKNCRLVVTSPESIVAGRLGPVLENHAETGWFARIVIDEAHIVDSWGSSFRVEFQLLGARLRYWRSIAPQGVRSLLLSATFGPGTTDTLKTLFAGEGVSWEEYVIQRLRPEIHYFSSGSDLDMELHERHVLDAVLHLPRPMIMYLTERKKAEAWMQRLKSLGLKRVECFHGETRQSERTRILDMWRSDNLDVVVATSAFGLGVDKADVRSVLHACYPENIDRYYQEVGRGGRDGAPCSAIALWTKDDREVGSRLGAKLLSDEEKISGRWSAMWNKAQLTELTTQYRIPLWVSPNYRLHERSYEESVTWNKRLLLMMERAQILQIENLSIDTSEEVDEIREWATVKMSESTITLQSRLPSLLKSSRVNELTSMSVGRERLDKLLMNSVPACRILREHYGRDTYRMCGSCSKCRVDINLRCGVASLAFRITQPRTTPLIDIVYGPSIESSKDEGIVILALRRVMQTGLSLRIITNEHFFNRVNGLVNSTVGQRNLPYRIDLLKNDTVSSIRANEIVICIHDRKISTNAALLHERGALCAHWILGSSQQSPNDMWPFLHEHQSRLFWGKSAIDDWVNSRKSLLSNMEKNASVH
jgi:ATP-dependent DNA helicase RecQ